MRLIHFNTAQPVPFAVALAGTTVDDFGNEIRLVDNDQWFVAATFTDENFFDRSLGFDGRWTCI